ncbi:outer membrane beta-barrel family protein [Flavobacterium sp. I3-2]|uniref:outer membrane beta-barrel family protein n=1 Tax=Flavobacterium sp. I3-2 TaxID=2748319 RepID=UPI0015AE5EBE|nr:outer membrane beta-barrel family protein [Flavobacterium sp. I3-2]
MKSTRFLTVVASLSFSSLVWAQTPSNEIFIKGTVVEASTNQPLEYANITLISTINPDLITGDVTDTSGNFNISTSSGTYNIRVEYLGYQTIEISNKEITESTDLGTFKIQNDSEVLEGLVVTAKRAEVEIKLDKRIYNVADNAIVRGGTASDVLDNIPSIQVDSDGNVSLRGNESVRVLIDGKPSGLASNIGDALKMLPSESIDRVEVITNPSARYEAEGGAGIINIILKKGSNNGTNGSVSVNVGDPLSYGVNANVNHRMKSVNLFANLGYSKNKTFGNSMNDSEYFNEDGTTSQFVNERSESTRDRNGFNGNFGVEWNITDKLTWNNGVTYRKSKGEIPKTLNYSNYNENYTLIDTRSRLTEEDDRKETKEYTTDFTYKFNDKGHQLFVSGSISDNTDTENSDISTISQTANLLSKDVTRATEDEKRIIARVDYVLPLGEGSQFEAGYLGNFNELHTSFDINSLNNAGVLEPNDLFRSDLEYKERVNAIYAQYGNKINKFSYMVGLRWEDTQIDVNQLINQDFNKKKYNDLFPSAFLSYELVDGENISASYSRRVRRPRGRMLNPISNYSSSINFFMGNPDLNPSFTDAYDFGYMKRFNHQFTLNASAYFNKTTDATQFVRRVDGVNEEAIPITISGPINLATEYRYGLELNLNYTPFSWWRLNANANLFQVSTRGNYQYIDYLDQVVNQNFDNDTFTFTGRLNSRVTLPGKVEWQTNVMYEGPQTTAQGKRLSSTAVNLAFSKDVLKEKGTLSLNVQDLFNSRKHRMDLDLVQSKSYSEMQWRERTINLSFTYRFNQSKNDRMKNQKKQMQSEDIDEMM